MTHGDLIRLIMLHIAPHGLVWQNNTGALFNRAGRLVRYGFPGSPDILACINGRMIGIECKVGRDRLSAAQTRFHAALELAGGVYIIARSIDDVAARLKGEGLC